MTVNFLKLTTLHLAISMRWAKCPFTPRLTGYEGINWCESGNCFTEHTAQNINKFSLCWQLFLIKVSCIG